MSAKSSLKEVAELAGVGYATASRALSGKGYVSPQTREKVQAAAEELNYVPNQLAKALREHRSALVGVIVPDLSNEYYSESLQTIQQDLKAAGYQMLVAEANSVQAQDVVMESLISIQAEGIIHVPVVGSIAPEGIPMVQLTRGELGPGFPRVLCDDEAGFFQLTESVLGGSGMNIAALVGEESLSTTQERMRGISHAASIYGAEVTFHFGHYSVESGEEMAQVVFNNGLPDALIVASPRLMAGVMRAFTRLNVRVPHDVVIGGYDDPEWYNFVGAGITTFVPPHEEMGKEAVRLLVDLIENPELPTGDVVLQGQVILRGSSTHSG
ncbi:LacI family transcriptional regulator [Corynebacterium glutamicum]|uniref:LacI family DNA-binding transcriptional regulator n=1 Tax=Corynebacterium glutamicum TaxID=1718 RepID=UPI0004F5AA0A|nr:LacI family DNA-binding transcriptional regulator [Corynebacterium glutamicum]AIK85476.1 LacI family transcriptional regulator [Corynebacterium glutamicum]AIK88261.1 LacI family transcriptional regulator [Corynebacterium glutamicum]